MVTGQTVRELTASRSGCTACTFCSVETLRKPSAKPPVFYQNNLLMLLKFFGKVLYY